MKIISQDLFPQEFVFLYKPKVEPYHLIALGHLQRLTANCLHVAIYVTHFRGIKLELILMVELLMFFLDILFPYPVMDLEWLLGHLAIP